MTSRGVIIALDLAVRTGVAVGEAGARPAPSAVVLKKPAEAPAVAYANMLAWLDRAIRKHRPALVFKEARLPLQAFRNLGNAESTVILHAGLHAVVEAVCARHGVYCDQCSDATIRKHFLGIGRLGDRATTKAAVVARCHLLGLLPRDCKDDNMADALAAWDFASAMLMRKPLPVVLFKGEAA